MPGSIVIEKWRPGNHKEYLDIQTVLVNLHGAKVNSLRLYRAA